MTLLSAIDLDNTITNVGLYAILVFIIWLTQPLWRKYD